MFFVSVLVREFDPLKVLEVFILKLNFFVDLDLFLFSLALSILNSIILSFFLFSNIFEYIFFKVILRFECLIGVIWYKCESLIFFLIKLFFFSDLLFSFSIIVSFYFDNNFDVSFELIINLLSELYSIKVLIKANFYLRKIME
jgi:hypothetical protein